MKGVTNTKGVRGKRARRTTKKLARKQSRQKQAKEVNVELVIKTKAMSDELPQRADGWTEYLNERFALGGEILVSASVSVNRAIRFQISDGSDGPTYNCDEEDYT